MKSKKIAVLGYGVVGSGTAEVFSSQSARIGELAETEIKYILDKRDFPGSVFEDRFVKDFSVISRDPEISVVAEAMGGSVFAYECVKSALISGKSVVTSNKELVAERGYELIELAKKNGVSFLFEASVGGGIPIIRPLSDMIKTERIFSVEGILNGTTNYILTKMSEMETDFSESLKEAQELGFAEHDPSDDIKGTDTARKAAILASVVSGKHVYPKDIEVTGIENITISDIREAKKKNAAVRLVASASFRSDGSLIEISVKPRKIPRSSPLYSVNGVFNAVKVTGEFTGDVMFYGRGAGKEPTAAAMVSDIAAALCGIKGPFWRQ